MPPFPRDTAACTPALPLRGEELPADLRDLAMDVTAASAQLGGRISPATRHSLVALLRNINSYYSNLIEGHHTRLADAERALRQEYDSDDEKRALQQEAVSHIQTEEALERRLLTEHDLEVTSPDFLRWLHRHFYDPIPDSLRIVTSERGRTRTLIPGQLRKEEVVIGAHHPPAAEVLEKFLRDFQKNYSLSRLHGDTRLIAAAASHHRLVWIHPFLDGNGRTARLFSHAYLQRTCPGYGLWSIARGLARQREAYMAHLAAADAPRRNDLDGRGYLSSEGLATFCRFFLETALDQAQFMDELLQLNGLRARVYDYAERRSKGLLPGLLPIKATAAPVLAELAMRGEIERGEVQRLAGVKERAATLLIKELLEVGLIESGDSHRSPLRLVFSSENIQYYLPGLYTGTTL